jgi:hypothetical protein
MRWRGDLPGSESSVKNIPDVNDIETTQMSLPVNDNTWSTHVSSSGNHDDVSSLKLDGVDNLVLDEIKFNSVVNFDSGVGVSDSSSIVGNNVGDTLGSELVLLDL